MKRTLALVAVSVAALGLAACSSGSSTPTVAVHGGPAVLGSTVATWQSQHAPNGAGYGLSVTVDGSSVPQFTSVKESGGRVVGWHQSFPAAHLAAAESLIRAQLPADARQTASWRGSFAGVGGAYCEFVNYQSPTLATWLGTAAPSAGQSNIGVALYESAGHRWGSSSIVVVNSADVGVRPAAVGQRC